jgi:hypothetical protein
LILVAVVRLGVIAAVRALGKSVDNAAQQEGMQIVAMLAMPVGLSGAGSTLDSELMPEPARSVLAASISRDTLNEIQKRPPAQVEAWWACLTLEQGMHADHASDLTIDPRHLWVGASSRDPVASAGSYNPALRGLSIAGSVL